MSEIVWIRPADFDPAVLVGSIIRPDASLPAFQVLERRQVVMMFQNAGAWEVRPFTQLTLKIAAGLEFDPADQGRASAQVEA